MFSVSVLGFVGHRITVVTPQVCDCSTEVAMYYILGAQQLSFECSQGKGSPSTFILCTLQGAQISQCLLSSSFVLRGKEEKNP